MRVGCIYHHDAFYASSSSGKVLPKYLVILALPADDDVVLRVLTSQHAHARPAGCYHGFPYAGFALGIPGGELSQPSWVDLRAHSDYDSDVFRGRMERGTIRPMLQLSGDVLRELLACAAGADDTTRRQSRHIRDAMAWLGG